MTTTEIVHQLRKGDSQALMELYRDHASTIFGAAFSILNNKVLAEDICHNCFLKLFEKSHELTQPEQLLGWMRKVARNEALMELRKNKRFDLSNDAADTLIIEEEEETEWNKYAVSDITQAIREMPEGYRVVLTLYLIEQLSHDEIAEILHIASATSRSQYIRGKKKLIEKLTLDYA